MKKRVFLIATMMTLMAVCAFGQSARKSYKAGMEFVDNLKYDDAIVQFTSAIGLEPSNPVYYYARGQAYEKLSKDTEAKSDFEKALVFAPKDVDAMISLGAVCNKLGDYEKSLILLNRASNIVKRNTKVYPEKVIALINLKKYDQALKVSDTAIIIKDTPMDYYWRGIIYRRLNNDLLGKKELEKSISKDKKLAEPRIELADLLTMTNPKEAMEQCNEVIKNDDRNTAAYIQRSRVFKKNLDYPSAINDISKTILIDPTNPMFYFERGKCYQEFNQHSNAINDFSKTISLNTERKAEDPNVYYSRAKSYEEIMDYDKARADYNKITFLSKYDAKAREMLELSQKRLYELNRETDPPEIAVVSPVPVKDTVEIKGDKTTLLISGIVKDKSKIKSFKINNDSVILVEKNGENDFLANINVTGIDKITLSAADDYDNKRVLNYALKRTEINPPKIMIVAPYTNDEGQVLLDTPTPNIAIQGKISDESRIKSITVGNFTASYNPNELNPSFTATLNVADLNNFTVVAEDIYGNRQETEFKLNREAISGTAANNPMGRTWVVFIENSSYETFASLDGPIKDISTIQRALANYQIANIIHKKDMTKAEMERFFNIELRDQIKKNQVKSLLVWYAGHGKFINDVGYWIPVDAKRDDEFTYFNINTLKAGLQGYSDVVVHTLVVSDACESGPGFYTAMRSALEAPTCDNTQVAGSKSAQVFSSAGYELAVDNSKFTATFANTLMNNKNACIPIETIVKSVTAAVTTDNGQKPKFGKIQGLDDFNGTFFFITK
jgi:tetratricopeptide (TPR) repeat protein